MKVDYIEINKAKCIVLDNENGFSITLNSCGASIYSISFNGEIMNMVPKNISDFFKSEIYYGKTIGPIVNRIRNGKVTINNEAYQMVQNEGKNTLHSGPLGLSNYKFTYAGVTKAEKVYILNFTLTTKKMKNGLPGKVNYQVSYAIFPNESKFTILYTAQASEDTPVSLTNHLFFTLGNPTIDNAYLTIPAYKYIETEKETLLPLEVKHVIDCLDFNKKKRITKDINNDYLINHKSKGYDHCFILNKKEVPIILENEKYALEITSDFDSVQIYSDNYTDGIDTLLTNEKVHRSIAIEPQDNLLGDRILRKGEIYKRYIEYKFTKK